MKKNNISLFTNIFDDGFPFLSLRGENNKLRTNIKETETQYIFTIDVAGVRKENIKITIDNGYMTVEVVKEEKNEIDENDYLRKEIYFGACSRSYYVGEIKEENITAAHQNGILTIIVPKDNQVEVKKSISIN